MGMKNMGLGFLFTARDLATRPIRGLRTEYKALDDSAAMLQVDEANGLLYLDGAEADDADLASLTVSVGEDAVTLVVEDEAAAELVAGVYDWDLKKITADGAAIPEARDT